jgi:hypothetical protein
MGLLFVISAGVEPSLPTGNAGRMPSADEAPMKPLWKVSHPVINRV